MRSRSTKTILILAAVALAGCSGRHALKELQDDDLYLALTTQGWQYEQAGDLGAAAAVYRQALKVNPRSALVNIQLSQACYRLGDARSALLFGRRAVGLEPGNADYRLVLGNAHMLAKDFKSAAVQYRQAYLLRPADNILHTLGGLYEAVGLPDSAEAVYLRRLAERNDLALRLQLGAILARSRRWEKALDQYRLAATADSANPRTQAAIAGLHQMLGRSDSALYYFGRAEEIEPTNVQLKSHILNLLLENKDYQAAALQAQNILALDPANRAARLQLARIFYNLGDRDRAETQYLALADRESTDTEALFSLARLRLDRMDFQGALDYLNKTLALLPDFREGWNLLGLCQLALDRQDSALASFARSHELGNPAGPDYQAAAAYSALERHREALPYYRKMFPKRKRDAPFLFGYASALERSGDYEKAVEVFRWLLKVDPKHASALNYLGYMFAERGVNLAEAEKLIAKALAIEPDNPYFIDSMGWVYFMSGRMDKAVVELERAVNLMPDDPTLRDHLGDAYRAQGQHRKALEQWRQALRLEPGKGVIREKINALEPQLP